MGWPLTSLHFSLFICLINTILNYIMGRPWSRVRQYKKADVQQIHLSAKKLFNHETQDIAQILDERISEPVWATNKTEFWTFCWHPG